MTESELFIEEVLNNNMTPINILNWYHNFYRLENMRVKMNESVACKRKR